MSPALKLKPLRTQLIGKLHVFKARHGLDDDTYRAALALATGKRSAGDMTEPELLKAVDHFTARGFKAPVKEASPQLRMAQALWISLWNLGAVIDRHDTALAAFIKRQTGLDSPAWMRKPADARKVIEALKDMCAREGVTFISPGLPGRDVVVAQWRKLELMEAIGLDGNGMRYGLGSFVEAQNLDETTMGNAQWAELSRLLGNMVRTAKAKQRRAA